MSIFQTAVQTCRPHSCLLCRDLCTGNLSSLLKLCSAKERCQDSSRRPCMADCEEEGWMGRTELWEDQAVCHLTWQSREVLDPSQRVKVDNHPSDISADHLAHSHCVTSRQWAALCRTSGLPHAVQSPCRSNTATVVFAYVKSSPSQIKA